MIEKAFYYIFLVLNVLHRQMKVNHELNNMTWRVKPDEVLIEVGKLFGSKVGLQKLNYEVKILVTNCY